MVDTVYKIQHRRGSIEDWVAVNPILGDGELGVLSGAGLAKMGDGVTPWVDLPYFNVVASDDLPLTGQDASAGVSDEVSRADHIHPNAGGAFLPLTGGTLTGDLKLQDATGVSDLILDGVGATGYGSINFRRNDKNRWIINTNSNTEPGDNSGSNLAIQSRNDDGSAKDTVLTIPRKTGIATFNKPLGVQLAGNTPAHNIHACSLRSGNVTETGYLVIKLPVTAANFMGQFIVKGYNYETPGGGHWQMTIGAYGSASSGWVTSRYNARADGKFPGNKRKAMVRLWHKGTSAARELAITIGETNTVWGYPFAALEIIGGFTGYGLALETPYVMEIGTDMVAQGWTNALAITPDTPFGMPNRYMSHPAQNPATATDLKTTGWTALNGDGGNGVITYSNGNFTVSEQGLYDLSWSYVFGTSTTGFRRVRIAINDNNTFTTSGPLDSSGYCNGTIGMQAVPLDVNDYVSLISHQTSGGSLSITGRMTMRKVGDWS